MAVLSKKLRKYSHLLAAFIIFLKGYDKMDQGDSGFWVFYSLVFIFLIIVIFHGFLAKRIKWIDAILYGLEAIIIFYIAYGYFSKGKTALPLLYVLAGLLYIVAAVVMSRRNMITPEH